LKKLLVSFIALAISFLSAAEPTAPPEATQVEIAGPVLMVTDLERSLKFYVAGLGMEIGSRLPGKPGPGATVTTDKQHPSPFVLLRQRSADTVSDTQPLTLGNGLSRIMLVVQDTAATAARLTAAGFKPDAPSASGIFLLKTPMAIATRYTSRLRLADFYLRYHHNGY